MLLGVEQRRGGPPLRARARRLWLLLVAEAVSVHRRGGNVAALAGTHRGAVGQSLDVAKLVAFRTAVAQPEHKPVGKPE